MKQYPTMKAFFLIAVPALLSGCNRPPECGIPDYRPAKVEEGSAGALAATDMCVAHWAKTYAKSKESAGDVADAAIAECAEIFRNLSYVSGKEPGSIVSPQTPAQLQQSFRKDTIRAVFRFRESGCRRIMFIG